MDPEKGKGGKGQEEIYADRIVKWARVLSKNDFPAYLMLAALSTKFEPWLYSRTNFAEKKDAKLKVPEWLRLWVFFRSFPTSFIPSKVPV